VRKKTLGSEEDRAIESGLHWDMQQRKEVKKVLHCVRSNFDIL
jgi:hypothetical protein